MILLFLIGLVFGFIIGYSTQHEVNYKKNYDIHIMCDSEEDMKTVMRNLKNINVCQKED